MDIFDIVLYAAQILIVLGVILAIVMPLVKSLDNPQSLIKTAVGVAALLVIFFIAYTLAGNEVNPKYAGNPFNLTPQLSKFVGGALLTTYALFIIAILGIVFTEINKAIR